MRKHSACDVSGTASSRVGARRQREAREDRLRQLTTVLALACFRLGQSAGVDARAVQELHDRGWHRAIGGAALGGAQV